MSYISKIRLKNIRGFRNLEVDILNGEKEPSLLTLIIGRNGTCKTTLLRAVVTGLCSETEAYALLSEPVGELITEGEHQAKIEVCLMSAKAPDNPLTITTRIEQDRGKPVIIRESEGESRPPEPPFLCGYGTGRSTTGSETGPSRPLPF